MKHPLLWIDWRDHCSQAGWSPIDDMGDPVVCSTVGFLVHEDDEAIVLASTLDNQSPISSNSRQQILKNCIVNQWELLK